MKQLMGVMLRSVDNSRIAGQQYITKNAWEDACSHRAWYWMSVAAPEPAGLDVLPTSSL
jgi:hypothetical protein